MKKIILLFVAVVLCVGVYFLVSYRTVQTPRSGDSSTVDPFPIVDRPPTATSGTPVPVPPVDTSTGGLSGTGSFSAQALLEDADTYADPYNDGHYYLGNRFPDFDGPATNSPPYVIEYFPQGQTFDIALLQEPISNSRLQAEQYLMNKLGLSKTQLCGLNYMVTVPVDVNEMYASIDLRFSACPDATFLP